MYWLFGIAGACTSISLYHFATGRVAMHDVELPPLIPEADILQAEPLLAAATVAEVRCITCENNRRTAGRLLAMAVQMMCRVCSEILNTLKQWFKKSLTTCISPTGPVSDASNVALAASPPAVQFHWLIQTLVEASNDTTPNKIFNNT
jgi:hypothetical protein